MDENQQYQQNQYQGDPNQQYQQNQYQGNPNQYQQYQGAPQQPYQPMIPEEYKPISMWGYFGYQILFAIPIVGLIFLIIYSITAKNINLKNYARSYFCVLIIEIILAIIIVSVVGVGALALGSYY